MTDIHSGWSTDQPATTSGSTSGTGATGAVAGAAEQVTQQVKEKVGPQVQDLRGRLREQARTQAQQRSDQAAEQARGVADSARSVADDLEEKGNAAAANVARMVGQRGEQVADYLSNSDGDKILRDLEAQARQRPWAVAGAAFVVGLVASRLLKASSQRRSDDYSRTLSSGGYRPALPPADSTYGTGSYGTASTYGTTGAGTYASGSYGTGTSDATYSTGTYAGTGTSSSGSTYGSATSTLDEGSLDITTGTAGDELPDAPQRGAR